MNVEDRNRNYHSILGVKEKEEENNRSSRNEASAKSKTIELNKSNDKIDMKSTSLFARADSTLISNLE